MCGVTRVGQKSNRYWRKPETLRRSLPAVKLSAMSEIVLATLNAKYIHASFGLRYLMANLGDLRSRASIHEFDINQKVNDIAEALLELNPKIIGFGIYIWNVVPSTELVVILKRLRPDITLILGGPEVSYETEGQPIVAAADYVIKVKRTCSSPGCVSKFWAALDHPPKSMPRRSPISPGSHCLMTSIPKRISPTG